jgi:hypothetical protein
MPAIRVSPSSVAASVHPSSITDTDVHQTDPPPLCQSDRAGGRLSGRPPSSKRLRCLLQAAQGRTRALATGQAQASAGAGKRLRLRLQADGDRRAKLSDANESLLHVSGTARQQHSHWTVSRAPRV